ncbi:MAG: NTP transferase domain-containing protein [Rickettsiales bacterium]|nr:NTP transferase domain-containing protein [Rickettsiales bacterium]
MIAQAMILAAGWGKRMMPLTSDTPKPLLLFHGRSIMDYMIERLAAAGIEKIVINGRYCADKVAEFIEQKRMDYPGIEFIFMREEEELDIARGVINALPHFNGKPFFVLNGDIFWTGDANIFKKLSDSFEKYPTPTLALCPLENQISTQTRGEFKMFSDGQISSHSDGLNMAYMGIHLTHADFMNNIPPSITPNFLSLSRKWEQLEESGELRGVIFDGALYHLSVPEDLETELRV